MASLTDDSRGVIYGHDMFIVMFVERKINYSALFTNLFGWHAGAASYPPSDFILAQLAFPLSDIMFWLYSARTNLSLYKHWFIIVQATGLSLVKQGQLDQAVQGHVTLIHPKEKIW